MLIRIHGHQLPGRRCGAYENVHVGVQRRAEVVELRPGDAPGVEWTFEVVATTGGPGPLDVRGPFVHGRPGARFLYLSWGTLDGDTFSMFRRAKLMFDGVDPALLAAARDGTLTATLPLTLPDGTPVCAAVRPPRIRWSA
ncbi:MAG: DUF5990 family protein [Pseudonocardia sp.]